MEGLGGILYGENMNRLPNIYRDAVLRNFTPVDHARMCMGLGFELSDGQTLRVALSVSDIEALLLGAKDYVSLFHSTRSNDMPSVEVSLTPEAENVWPPARSSAAASGE